MQIVGYVRSGQEHGPALVVATDGDLESLALEPGTDLAFALRERHCAGAVVDGRHERC